MKLTDDMGIAVAERLGVRLTNPNREALPDGGVTKGQLVAYYDAVAERMLPHIEKRALSLVRVPHGSRPFFQKHDTGGFPDAMKRVAIELKESDKQDHFYLDDLAGIVAGVQMSALEFHIWGSRIETLEKPDRIIFDIDPDEGLDFKIVRQAAIRIRDVLGEWGLQSFPMVTGGKGIHVIAPLQPVTEWPLVKLFCRTFAQKLEDNEPDSFTANIRKVDRKGRMSSTTCATSAARRRLRHSRPAPGRERRVRCRWAGTNWRRSRRRTCSRSMMPPRRRRSRTRGCGLFRADPVDHQRDGGISGGAAEGLEAVGGGR